MILKSLRNNKYLPTVCVLLFIGAIVTADLLVTRFGPSALPFTAFFLIPFDLVTRDILHERWKGKYLWEKMFLLTLTGSGVAYFLNQEALNVARASVCAFSMATLVNTITYHYLHKYKPMVKMNVSNLFAAITDSIIFPFVAFGVLPLSVMIQQSGAKFLGGLLWAYIFIKILKLRG